jgi:hypothetical protein
MDLTAGITDLGTTLLASVDGPSAESIVFTDRNMTPGTSRCLGASGDGCVHVEGTQNLGTATLGGLPPNLPAGALPAGWQGYFVRVSNFTSTTKAEVGAGTAAPTLAVSGTISYWNGSGYSTMTLSPGASVAIPVAPLTITTTLNFLTLSITIQPDGQLKTGGTLITDPANCGASCSRTAADAMVSSPVVGDLLYTVTYASVILADFRIHTDLGTLEANGEYKQSPSS